MNSATHMHMHLWVDSKIVQNRVHKFYELIKGSLAHTSLTAYLFENGLAKCKTKNAHYIIVNVNQ